MAHSSGEVNTRRMVNADLPRVNEIDNLLFGEERVSTWPFSFEDYWEIHGPGISFVAEVGGEVVGFLVGNIVQEEHSQSILNLRRVVDDFSRVEQVGWIDMIGILPEFQNRRVGRALVKAFQEECKRNNAPMRGIVKEGDERLQKFLESLGFKKWEMATYEKD